MRVPRHERVNALADGLALDGTHLHPSYVRFIEAALPAVTV